MTDSQTRSPSRTTRSPTLDKAPLPDSSSEEKYPRDVEGLAPGAIDPAVERRATLKMDLVVVPIVAMYYLLSFLDRSNIGNARIAGLQTELNMTTHQFSVALTITYVPYIVMELPMNLLMKRLGANVTLPVMVILWGMICACQGAVKSYSGLLVCRFFLGAVEGGLFPGVTLYLSNFYKRHAMQFRFAMMFSVTSLAGAFSGLLAAAIENMDGVRGLGGWAWIFILEGLFTTLFGIFSLLWIPATPADVNLLTPQEKEVYVRVLENDWNTSAEEDETKEEKFSWSEVWSCIIDAPHVLLICIPLFGLGVTLYGLANFTPTIVNSLGYSTVRTQLLTVPPYACSFVVSLVVSYFSDKMGMRGPMTIFVCLIATAGYALFKATGNIHADYGALFLQIIGIYSAAPCLCTWNPNNVQPHYRRATAIAFGFIATNLGGIVSTWLFTDSPRYPTAADTNLAFALAMAVFSALVMWDLSRRNQQKKQDIDRLLKEQGAGTEPGGWDSTEVRRRLGDRHPRFMYTL